MFLHSSSNNVAIFGLFKSSPDHLLLLLFHDIKKYRNNDKYLGSKRGLRNNAATVLAVFVLIMEADDQDNIGFHFPSFMYVLIMCSVHVKRKLTGYLL